MIRNATLGTTIVTADDGLGIAKMGGHGLTIDGSIEVSKLGFHVDDGATADRTSIGGLHVLVIAFVMDAMTAWHEDDRLR